MLTVAGCASPPPAIARVEHLPATDPLYRPRRVEPGRLEYAPDRTAFAPVLTERFPYPSQAEADAAYGRLLAAAPAALEPRSVRLFGCKPGVIDGRTARVTRVSGPAVHCATDVFDSHGRQLGRRSVNFVYDDMVWTMRPVDPPRSPAPWLAREGSPKDPWRWVPFRDRYE